MGHGTWITGIDRESWKNSEPSPLGDAQILGYFFISPSYFFIFFLYFFIFFYISQKYEGNMKECSSIHGPWDLQKLRVLTVGLGKMGKGCAPILGYFFMSPTYFFIFSGSQILGSGGTPENRHETFR